MASQTTQHTPQAQQQPRKVVHLPTVEAYNRWAAVYDSDGNILQALDSYALPRTMIPRLLRSLPSKDEMQSLMSPADDDALYITDLGCGTGRATLLLLSSLRCADRAGAAAVAERGYGTICLTGIDASPGMLKIASQRVLATTVIDEGLTWKAQLRQWDILDPESPFKPVEQGGEGKLESGDAKVESEYALEPAHAIISTLVLEHVPLDVYFERAKGLLRPGGVFLVTNMHEEMGNSTFGPSNGTDARAQSDIAAVETPIATAAGFIDTATNTKIRGVSYAHSIKEVLHAAEKVGLELVGDQADEITVEPWMFERGPCLGDRGRKWIGIKCWYGMIFRRRA